MKLFNPYKWPFRLIYDTIYENKTLKCTHFTKVERVSLLIK